MVSERPGSPYRPVGPMAEKGDRPVVAEAALWVALAVVVAGESRRYLAGAAHDRVVYDEVVIVVDEVAEEGRRPQQCGED